MQHSGTEKKGLSLARIPVWLNCLCVHRNLRVGLLVCLVKVFFRNNFKSGLLKVAQHKASQSPTRGSSAEVARPILRQTIVHHAHVRRTRLNRLTCSDVPSHFKRRVILLTHPPTRL